VLLGCSLHNLKCHWIVGHFQIWLGINSDPLAAKITKDQIPIKRYILRMIMTGLGLAELKLFIIILI
jgi:hypothetical protein